MTWPQFGMWHTLVERSRANRYGTPSAGMPVKLMLVVGVLLALGMALVMVAIVLGACAGAAYLVLRAVGIL